MRRLGDRLHVFESHTDEVLHLAWSPHNAGVFASASSDRRINIWDLAQIGAEQTPDDQEDGPPELMFVHGGRYFRFDVYFWRFTEINIQGIPPAQRTSAGHQGLGRIGQQRAHLKTML